MTLLFTVSHLVILMREFMPKLCSYFWGEMSLASTIARACVTDYYVFSSLSIGKCSFVNLGWLLYSFCFVYFVWRRYSEWSVQRYDSRNTSCSCAHNSVHNDDYQWSVTYPSASCSSVLRFYPRSDVMITMQQCKQVIYFHQVQTTQ